MPRAQNVNRRLTITVAEIECADLAKKEFRTVKVRLAREHKNEDELLKAARKVLPANLTPSHVLKKEVMVKHFSMREQDFIDSPNVIEAE